MLCRLSLKNIRRSIRDYTIYFITLVLGIAIFYVFNAIHTQASFLIVSSTTKDILLLLDEVITGFSVFIAMVLGALIVYASRFLMKRRSREFALYMTLGMRKTSIARILGMESLIIGLFSLVTGLILGVALSQIMSTVVAQLFEADMTEFVFTFSAKACLKTVLYFAVIMAVVVIFDMILVGKSRLISLMQTGSRVEKVRMKSPVLCILVFAAGTAILVIAYRMVTHSLDFLTDPQMILVPIAMGAAATFLIFWSLSGLFLGIISRLRKVYYQDLNSFTFRQLSGRVNTMVISITIICLMLFFTISIMSAAFSIRDSLNQNIRELTPVDIQLRTPLVTPETEITYQDMYEGYLEYREYSAAETGEKKPETELSRQQFDTSLRQDIPDIFMDAGYDLTEYFGEYESTYIYKTEKFTLSDALGTVNEQLAADHSMITYNKQDIMTIGDYNRLAGLYGKEPLALGEDEYLILCDFDPMMPYWEQALAQKPVYQIFGHELHPASEEVVYGFVYLTSIHENLGIVIVPDDAVDPAYRASNILTADYAARDDAARRESEEKIQTIIDDVTRNWTAVTTLITYNSKIDIRDSSVGIGVVVTFLGLYLGFVFMISGAAILALKALSDSIDSRGRYQMLRQLGAEEREIGRSLFRQQIILFLLPLVMAGIHSVFGIRFAQLLLQQMGTGMKPLSLVLTALIMLLIYGVYFLVTYRSSRRIIKKTAA